MITISPSAGRGRSMVIISPLLLTRTELLGSSSTSEVRKRNMALNTVVTLIGQHNVLIT